MLADACRASYAQVSAADLQRVAKKMLKSPVSVRQIKPNIQYRTVSNRAEAVLNTVESKSSS